MQSEQDFFEKHKNADEIVFDARTNEVVKAVYTLDRVTYSPRKYPAEYYFPEY